MSTKFNTHLKTTDSPGLPIHYKVYCSDEGESVVGYIINKIETIRFLSEKSKEEREKLFVRAYTGEIENAEVFFEKNDGYDFQPRKRGTRIYPKYINGMTERDIQRIIEAEKKNADVRDIMHMVSMLFLLAIYFCFMLYVWIPGMDRFIEASSLPMLINLLIILVSGAIVLLGVIFVPVFLPMQIIDKLMEAPPLRSGEKIEDYVRQKYAYKVPTTEEQTEQKQAKLQAGTSTSNNEEEK